LKYFEEHYYRSTITKLQDKLRNTKVDEKLRDQLLQMIEKENQITFDIIKNIKNDFNSKLEPYCSQYQVIIERLISLKI
jgi:hypothetical protein